MCGRDRKAENDSEWRTNPFGHIAESNTKYQNLIISIIIFIIFIHFLPVGLNALSLSLSLLLPLPLPLLYINLFFPSIALSTGNMWACQSRWLTALKWPTESSSFFSPFLFFFFGQTLWALSGNPIYCGFSGRKGLPLTLTDSSQICQPQCRDFL